MPKIVAFTAAPSRKVEPKNSKKLKILSLTLPSFNIIEYWWIINSRRFSLPVTGVRINPPMTKFRVYIKGINGPVIRLVTVALARLALKSTASKKAKINPIPKVGIKLMPIPKAHPNATLYGLSFIICFSIVS